MKETELSLEAANSGLAEWAQRAQREQTTFIVLEAAKPIARLIPTMPSHCKGSELARALSKAKLSTEDSKSWASDLLKAREAQIATFNRRHFEHIKSITLATL